MISPNYVKRNKPLEVSRIANPQAIAHVIDSNAIAQSQRRYSPNTEDLRNVGDESPEELNRMRTAQIVKADNEIGDENDDDLDKQKIIKNQMEVMKEHKGTDQELIEKLEKISKTKMTPQKITYLQNKAKVVFSPNESELNTVEKRKLTIAIKAVKKYERKDIISIEKQLKNLNRQLEITLPEYIHPPTTRLRASTLEQRDVMQRSQKKLNEIVKPKPIHIQPYYAEAVKIQKAKEEKERENTPIIRGRKPGTKNKPKSAKEDD